MNLMMCLVLVIETMTFLENYNGGEKMIYEKGKGKVKKLMEPKAAFGYDLDNESRKPKKIKVERMDDTPEISYE